MANLIPAKKEIGKLYKKYIDTDKIDITEKYDDFEIVVEKSKNANVIKFSVHYYEDFKTYACSYPNNNKPFDMGLLECHLQKLDD